MTIFTHVPNTQMNYPALYLPLRCVDIAVIEHIPIGIYTSPSNAYVYPLLVTSYTSTNLHIR